MALADSNMVLVPGHGTLHDLPVDARITAELVVFSPVFQIEEVAEELEGFILPSSRRPSVLPR